MAAQQALEVGVLSEAVYRQGHVRSTVGACRLTVTVSE